MGAWMHGIAATVVWGAEKLGRGPRLVSSMGVRMRRRYEKKNPFGDYIPGEQDVVVATHSKSGTNWMMQIAHQLLWHGESEFGHIHEVVPWPDSFGATRGYAIPIEDDSVWRACPEQKRVVKTHLNWGVFPYSEKARYIMVIRDPKDVFVSNYFFVRGVMGPAMPSVDTWYKMFLSDNSLIDTCWAVNTAGYWGQRHRPNVRVFSFKEMKRDLRGTVSQVADFFGMSATDGVIDKVAEISSFPYMKKIDDKFSPGKILPWTQMTMMRKGKQGDSAELLSPERQREMDAHFIAKLKQLGSDFPYEEFCNVAK
jgi:hypothetical protein